MKYFPEVINIYRTPTCTIFLENYESNGKFYSSIRRKSEEDTL